MLGFKLVILKTEAVSSRYLSSSSLSKFCFVVVFFFAQDDCGKQFCESCAHNDKAS